VDTERDNAGHTRRERSPLQNPLIQRVVRAAALALIVGVAVGILYLAGILGRESSVSQSGIPIENARLLDTARPESAGFEIGPAPGKLAPDFEVSDFEGDRVKLSDFRGRPVYVNFWASWCIPCRVEMPDIYQVLQERGGPDGLAVISVNRGEPLGRARSFLEGIRRKDGGEGVSFTVDALDPDDTLYRAYRGLGMPVSIFVDRDGVVTKVFNGQMRLADMQAAVTEAERGWAKE